MQEPTCAWDVTSDDIKSTLHHRHIDNVALSVASIQPGLLINTLSLEFPKLIKAQCSIVVQEILVVRRVLHLSVCVHGSIAEELIVLNLQVTY